MRVLIALLVAAAGVTVIAAEERGSPPLVKQFVAAMSARQLDAIAVPDLNEPGRFIAALVFPDVQMLVVSSRHQSADLLKRLIANKRYRDVYLALNDGTSESRLFFQDMGCDGVQDEASDTTDVFYEGVSGRTIFDGQWRAQSLTAAAYAKKQEEADLYYSRALAQLLHAVRQIPVDAR